MTLRAPEATRCNDCGCVIHHGQLYTLDADGKRIHISCPSEEQQAHARRVGHEP